MSLTIQIDSPFKSAAKLAKDSGLPVRTIQSLVHEGRLPRFDTRLDKDKRGPVYINMVRLHQLCEEQGKDFISLNLTES